MRQSKKRKLDLLFKQEKFKTFKISTKPGYVICKLDNIEVRNFKSDMVIHLESKTHREKIIHDNNLIENYLIPKEKEKSKDEFNILFTIHMISCNIPLTNIDNIFSKKLLLDLKNNEIFSGKYLQMNFIERSFDYCLNSIKKKLLWKDYSLLFDESSFN